MMTSSFYAALSGLDSDGWGSFGEAVGLACDMFLLRGISTIAPKGQHRSRWGNAPSYGYPTPPTPKALKGRNKTGAENWIGLELL